MKHLRRRLERLEKSLMNAPLLLHMPNGSMVRLPGHASYVLDLMMQSLDGNELPDMELIARSISSEEPGGAHMVDVARHLYAALKKQMQSRQDYQT